MRTIDQKSFPCIAITFTDYLVHIFDFQSKSETQLLCYFLTSLNSLLVILKWSRITEEFMENN